MRARLHLSAADSHLASRPRVVIAGAGWGAFAVAKRVVASGLLDVSIVSPRNHLVFTPLLPSAAVGTIDFRSISEPVKHAYPTAAYEQAEVVSVDPASRTVEIESPSTGSKGDSVGTSRRRATLPYDALVIAVGARNNTFGIPGVEEHAYFLKELAEARAIRRVIVRNVEAATFPGVTPSERARLLSVVIVGGGPTGVEFAAELHDFVTEDIVRLYPDAGRSFRITVVEGRSVLGSFDQSLREYTARKFARDHISILTGANVTAVSNDAVTLSDGNVLPSGLTVWNTGLGPRRLVQELDGHTFRKDSWGHLVVDGHLRALRASLDPAASRPPVAAVTGSRGQNPTHAAPHGTDLSDAVLPGVYAIGDAAAVDGGGYASTAQVAEQQGLYLGDALVAAAKATSASGGPAHFAHHMRALAPKTPTFEYRHRGAFVYLGSLRAAADFTRAEGARGSILAPLYGRAMGGMQAFMLYRSAYLTQLGSWRNRLQVPVDWARTWFFGRDTTHF